MSRTGDTPGERNVISGNDGDGVRIYNSDATGNVISRNYIGVDASGTLDLGNSATGVSISRSAHANAVGGDTPGERNVISGNGQNGIFVSGGIRNTIRVNYVGVAADGVTPLGNALRGVWFRDVAQSNILGPGNVIVHSVYFDGVVVDGAGTISNTITQNSIYGNDGMGIDLVGGANGGITPSVILTASGWVDVVGTACAGCTVEVFASSDTDGEGETYIGSATATPGGAFTVTVSSVAKCYLTATATDVISGTSEFSAVFTVERSNVYLPLVAREY